MVIELVVIVVMNIRSNPVDEHEKLTCRLIDYYAMIRATADRRLIAELKRRIHTTRKRLSAIDGRSLLWMVHDTATSHAVGKARQARAPAAIQAAALSIRPAPCEPAIAADTAALLAFVRSCVQLARHRRKLALAYRDDGDAPPRLMIAGLRSGQPRRQ